MSEVKLRRPLFTVFEGLKSVDVNRVGDLALQNLGLVERFFHAPAGGVYRGLEVDVRRDINGAPSPDMTVRVLPGAAIADTGLIVLESERSLEIPANNSGKPRIDLIFARYAEAAGSVEPRPFKNGSLVTTVAVGTQTISDPVIGRIAGTPADDPSAPAPVSASDIPLASVRVNDGDTYIPLDRITRVETYRTAPLRIGQNAGGSILTLPWINSGAPLLQLPAPVSTQTLLIGQATFDVTLVNEGKPLRLAIIEATPASDIGGAGTIVGDSFFTRSPGAVIGQQSLLQTVTVMGVASRPFTGVRNYRLKLGYASNINEVDEVLSSAANITLAALTL